MGKTKIKTIDDSGLEKSESQKSQKSQKIKNKKQTTPVIPNVSEESSQSMEDRHVVPQSGTPRDDKKGKSQKPGKAKPRSKRYQETTKDLDRTKTYPIPEAVDMVKKLSYAKFNATIEAHINTTAQGLRGQVFLPFASGHKLRILAFGKGAEESGADIFGTNSIIENISSGKVDFDLLITTPEWMPKLTKVAKVLGPKGLMPNPKNGTIVSGEDGLKKAVESFQAGRTEYKTEPKAPVIHLPLGKLNQPTEELSANIKTLLSTLGKTRIKQVRLAPTMGPSVKVDLSSI